MNVTALFDPLCNLAAQVQMSVLLARGRAIRLTLLLTIKEIEQARAKALAQVRNAIAHCEGFAFVDPGAPADAAKVEPAPVPVACEFLDPSESTAELVAQVRAKVVADLLVVFLHRCDPRDEVPRRIGDELVPLITCAIAVVRLVDEAPPLYRRILVPAGHAVHARGALRLGVSLTPPDGRCEAVFVEPPIGADAESVGAQELERILAATLPDDDRNRIGRRIAIDEDRQRGVAGASDAAGSDLVVVGCSSIGVLDERFHGTLAGRLCRHLTKVTVIVLRDALPAGHRLRRRAEALLQRLVPQLDRTTRVDLTQRVQSNSAWNFDFVALISLATSIAAMGLLQDSGAVIIGAMLVAPLMTPILGLGLALVQGNTMLAKLALRSITLGVGTAFGLAVLIGFANGDFAPSAEMLARGWPGVLDLVVAFVSGLAAAYATSRPGLFAALPGVAIAASLVPPIATSGLAISRGEFALAYGSFLLFFTNMVAIVLATRFSLWAVGLRASKAGVRWLRHLGNLFVVLSLALAMHLNTRAHVGGALAVPDDCAAEVAARLPEGVRLVGLEAIEGGNYVAATLRLGCPSPPPVALATELAGAMAERLRREVRVRLVHEWEAHATAAPK